MSAMHWRAYLCVIVASRGILAEGFHTISSINPLHTKLCQTCRGHRRVLPETCWAVFGLPCEKLSC